MELVLQILILAVGFVLLVKGADFFVDGAAGIAKKMKIPSMVIGLTIVAMGTSAPEAAVSISAAMAGSNAIAVSNIVGSNIFNLLMVTGISALIIPLAVPKVALSRDLPLSALAAAVLLLLCADPNGGFILSRNDGLILLLLFLMFLYINFMDAFRHKPTAEQDNTPIMPLWKGILFTVGGLAGVIIGGQLVVNSSTAIARAAGISETLIGLTIVAIGTSLPELVTSIVAARKGEADIAVGNVLGSNIFNILFILGLSAFIQPITVSVLSLCDMGVLLAISAAFLLLTFRKHRLTRFGGSTLVAMYVAYTAYIMIR